MNMKYLILALLLTGCTPKNTGISCLDALTGFLSLRSGMPGYQMGWVISTPNVPFYTWSYRPKGAKGVPVEYIAAARSLDDLENKDMHPYEQCFQDGEYYILFKLKGHVR